MKKKGITGLEDTESVKKLFFLLDKNKDNLLDLVDFLHSIKVETNADLARLIDVIKKNSLKLDDLLKKMGLSRKISHLDEMLLKKAIKGLDQTLADFKA